MDILKLLMVVILIGLTAFLWLLNLQLLRYVAVVLINSLAKRRGALAAKKVTTNLDEYLSACQLGITITALGLGWLGNQPLNIYSSRCFKIKILTCNFQYSFIYYCLCSNYIFTCCHWGTCSKDICYTKSRTS